ncbi:DUF5392 family protein [Desertibacillus haloalkaliphilus]|uniref:DUF5392 family protein n=1 Tax=Desertibacillus haloalkaliphilus TaxID=1328930 RepID=UPI001C26F8BC|nr:DUF5392 family protein [Desertibacillus haloalkaliphilus]MBU8906670.1 DUF5392 family protein [Desertibacillus haloalkaliphilus]
MLSFNINKFPRYTRNELEKIQKLIAPAVKKSTIFIFLSMSMISFSIINLYYLIFGTGTSGLTIFVLLFSLLGALGVALYKESLHKNKEIQQLSREYIIDRITKSEHLPDDAKDKYVAKIQADPKTTFEVFFQSLDQEERMKKQCESE